MTYNDYKNDLMDNYGAIDRVWKIDGDKLIRVDGEGVEQYFYDLHISQKNGFWALFDEVKNFNLVYNKQIIKLNLFQRYKLFGLLNVALNVSTSFTKGTLLGASLYSFKASKIVNCLLIFLFIYEFHK